MLAYRRSLQGIELPSALALFKAALCGVEPAGNPTGFGHCLFRRESDRFNSSGAIDNSKPAQYTKFGRISGPYVVQRTPVFAVVEVGPTQFKVSADDLVYAEKLKGVDVNDKVSLNRVLTLGSRFETLIGRPFIPGASVTAAVEEQTLDAKVLIFHKRRRKNSKKMKGHRQELTCLRILEVHGIDADASSPVEVAA